jgi:predicted TPR repeat methyltransferase
MQFWITLPLPLKKPRSFFISLLQSTAKYDEIYDEEYFSDIVYPYMANSCDVIADSIIEVFSPQMMVDVGCGTGLLLCAMKEKGVRQCLGIDCVQTALDICKERGLHVIKLT